MTNHTSKHYRIDTDTFSDLIGIEVGCPHKGILKNFVLKKKSKEFWFEYQCYSSVSDDIDEGEPIIKSQQFTLEEICENYFTRFIFVKYPLYYSLCPLDFGLNSFKIYNDNNGYLKIKSVCYPLKPKYSTKIEIKTEEGYGVGPSLDGLDGIVFGSQETEDDENIAYPLRGFKHYIYNKEIDISGYYYGYSVLRNMKKELECAKQTFESLRNSNTQKD